jgi:class I lanthipeptide synthase
MRRVEKGLHSERLQHMEKESPPQSAGITAVEFFIVRTPLLPIDDLVAWSAGIEYSDLAQSKIDLDTRAQLWKSSVALLRNRLREIIERPEVLQALHIASPSLQCGIERWKCDPDSKEGIQAERSLVRYLSRMCTRPTPFGLFAGCSVGDIGSEGETTIELAPRSGYRPSSRLDFHYLVTLTEELRRIPEVAMALRYSPNSSLHRAGNAWHYVESRIASGTRTHHLVRVESDAYLETVLARSRGEATISELVEALRQVEISDKDAAAYVQQVIDSNILESTLAPLLTGPPPLDDIILQLETIPGMNQVFETLRTVRSRLAVLDEAGIGASPEQYNRITPLLRSLPAQPDLAHLYQVDIIKPVCKAVLTKPVIDELIRGATILSRLGRSGDDAFVDFRRSFSERYGDALVPLVEALDGGSGVGFGRAKADASPLIRGIQLDPEEKAARHKFRPFHSVLIRKVTECLAQGKTELELEFSDLPDGETVTLPDSFALDATLIMEGNDIADPGGFQLHLRGGAGPDGARYWGRFCHSDSRLAHCIQDYLQQEEALNPEAVYAEIVHLPEGRLGLGNVLCRPVLRKYEIVYMGRSGAPLDGQLPITDLLVALEHDQIVLYSRRLARRIIPRLTNAHNFTLPGLDPVYQFLCLLQMQNLVRVPSFSWGPLDELEFLPRVRMGRLILATAQWRLTEDEVKTLCRLDRCQFFFALQELRHRRRLPRWIALEEADHILTVDLDNVLSVDAFGHVLKRQSAAILREIVPAPEHQSVIGPEGRFCHELHVPFVRKHRGNRSPGVPRSADLGTSVSVNRKDRSLASFTNWLYVKLYGGTATIDNILVSHVAPLTRFAVDEGIAQRWFFVRYTDPHDHLRIRFQGAPDRLSEELLPLISKYFNPLLESGEIWRIQFDTYDREIERYGGLDGVIAAEEIFHRDSEAVLDILKALEGDAGLDVRWRAALLGVDSLFKDCGLDLETRWTLMEKSRKPELRKQLGERFRIERRRLESLMESASGLDPELCFAKEVFDRRSLNILDPLRRLTSLAEAGTLLNSMPLLALSYAHMHVNRLIRSSARVYEMVLYDFLARLYSGQLARAKDNRGSHKSPHLTGGAAPV